MKQSGTFFPSDSFVSCKNTSNEPNFNNVIGVELVKLNNYRNLIPLTLF